MASTVGKRDVIAALTYWRRIPGQSVTTDFTTPGGEQRFAELDKYDETYTALIHDIRDHEDEYTLQKNGFQYVRHQVHGLDRSMSEIEIERLLVPATQKLVEELTGAAKTILIAHRIRSKAIDESKRADNRAPAFSVHSDFTRVGAEHHLETIVKDPVELAEIKKGRVYIINAWRPLKVVTKDPLAVCDWASVDPKEDWIANRFVHSNGWNELGKVAHSNQHKWLYMSDQQPSELLIFKQFDSKADYGVTLAHSAFVDPKFVDDDPRESIEIKMFVFVPE